MNSDLKHWIFQQLQNCPVANHPGELTVGIEHEFFLWDPILNKPCTHEQSQHFLRSLARSTTWYIRDEDNEIGIKRVSSELPNNRFCAIKYDHAPHLMEIAFSYSNQLSHLHHEVREVLEFVNATATQVGLQALHRPSIPNNPLDPAVLSPFQEYKNLRYYRSLLLERNQHPNDPDQNYAAVIAATQTHIGGFSWWKTPESQRSIALLYSYEIPIIEQWNYKRWQGYNKVFSNYPLVGFPKMTAWNLDHWVDALLRSPLAGGPQESWASHTTFELHKSPFGKDWDAWFRSVRDLQIIRPKLFGTLEFRADAAQPDVDHIMAFAALRLGLVAKTMASRENDLPNPFISLSKFWWKLALNDTPDSRPNGIPSYDEILELAIAGLSLRSKGEKVFLEPLFPPHPRRAHA